MFSYLTFLLFHWQLLSNVTEYIPKEFEGEHCLAKAYSPPAPFLEHFTIYLAHRPIRITRVTIQFSTWENQYKVHIQIQTPEIPFPQFPKLRADFIFLFYFFLSPWCAPLLCLFPLTSLTGEWNPILRAPHSIHSKTVSPSHITQCHACPLSQRKGCVHNNVSATINPINIPVATPSIAL